MTKHIKSDIKDIICGFQYNIYIDKNDDFWVAGHNYYGSCDIAKDGKESIIKLLPITHFKQNKITIQKIRASICGLGTFWITNKNKFYANGANSVGELGICTNNEFNNIYKPILLQNLYKVVDV